MYNAGQQKSYFLPFLHNRYRNSLRKRSKGIIISPCAAGAVILCYLHKAQAASKLQQVGFTTFPWCFTAFLLILVLSNNSSFLVFLQKMPHYVQLSIWYFSYYYSLDALYNIRHFTLFYKMTKCIKLVMVFCKKNN